jgi:hypothetical protein
MPLTGITAKNARAAERGYKLFDSHDLFLFVDRRIQHDLPVRRGKLV